MQEQDEKVNMFRRNPRRHPPPLCERRHELPPRLRRMLKQSWAETFRREVFSRIQEERDKVLYADGKGRPNLPVSLWVGLEILKGLFNWTDWEMLEQVHFNYAVAYALGLEALGAQTVGARTIYYNRRRLLE